jgi:exonuclease 3'-5' domain-containing protein 1
MPKCAARHLPKGAAAAEASLAALDGPAAFSDKAGAALPPPDAAAVARVTEYLKKKVKEMYAPDKGGDGNLWALRPMVDDVRRYAALDAWLLQEIHAAMLHGQSLDEAWTKRVWAASATRTSEYRDLTEPVLQFRDPERAAAPDF